MSIYLYIPNNYFIFCLSAPFPRIGLRHPKKKKKKKKKKKRYLASRYFIPVFCWPASGGTPAATPHFSQRPQREEHFTDSLEIKGLHKAVHDQKPIHVERQQGNLGILCHKCVERCCFVEYEKLFGEVVVPCMLMMANSVGCTKKAYQDRGGP